MRGISFNLFFFLILLFACHVETGNCRHNRLTRNQSANGIVLKKEENVKQANSCEILYFPLGRRYAWCDQVYEYDKRSFYNKIMVGDSIVKERGSLEMYVYRIDTSFVIDLSFPCKN